MENIQYSSKPWFMDELGSICFTDPVYGICQICHVPDIDNPEQKVNANLLMAAPDLLAACERLFIWRQKETPLDLLEQAECAIAKAKGGE